MIYLILGGIKSGKTAFALETVNNLSKEKKLNKTYLASQTYFLLYANPEKGNIFKILDANKVKK